MPFVKLDCNIMGSSIYWQPNDAFKAWITLLALAGPDGIARVSEAALAGMCQVSLERITEILNSFQQPDPQSRSQKDQGVRVQRVDGGFFITNYKKYREKDHTAPERMKRYRERQRVTRNRGVTLRSVTQAEAEAEADKRQRIAPKSASELPDWLDAKTWESWKAYRKEIRKPLTKSSESKQIAFLAEHEAQHVAIIETSIRNGWTGLFQPDAQPKGHRLSAVERVRLANPLPNEAELSRDSTIVLNVEKT